MVFTRFLNSTQMQGFATAVCQEQQIRKPLQNTLQKFPVWMATRTGITVFGRKPVQGICHLKDFHTQSEVVVREQVSFSEVINASKPLQDMLLDKCKFLSETLGRGGFYIFQGTLWLCFACLGFLLGTGIPFLWLGFVLRSVTDILDLAVGLALVACGMLNMLMHFGGAVSVVRIDMDSLTGAWDWWPGCRTWKVSREGQARLWEAGRIILSALSLLVQARSLTKNRAIHHSFRKFYRVSTVSPYARWRWLTMGFPSVPSPWDRTWRVAVKLLRLTIARVSKTSLFRSFFGQWRTQSSFNEFGLKSVTASAPAFSRDKVPKTEQKCAAVLCTKTGTNRSN